MNHRQKVSYQSLIYHPWPSPYRIIVVRDHYSIMWFKVPEFRNSRVGEGRLIGANLDRNVEDGPAQSFPSGSVRFWSQGRECIRIKFEKRF